MPLRQNPFEMITSQFALEFHLFLAHATTVLPLLRARLFDDVSSENLSNDKTLNFFKFLINLNLSFVAWWNGIVRPQKTITKSSQRILSIWCNHECGNRAQFLHGVTFLLYTVLQFNLFFVSSRLALRMELKLWPNNVWKTREWNLHATYRVLFCVYL